MGTFISTDNGKRRGKRVRNRNNRRQTEAPEDHLVPRFSLSSGCINCPLPPEIIDAVIDHLWSDRSSLRACSLTCKDWLHRSRLHYFYQIHLRQHSIRRISSSLDSPSASSISPYIRHLVFSDLRATVVSARNQTDTVLCKLKDRVSSVQTLQFIDCDSTAETFRAITRVFRHQTKHLVISDVYFPDFINFMDLVESFPSLEELSIDRINWLGAKESALTLGFIPRQPISRICFLDIGDKHAGNIVEWVLAHEFVPRIDVLHFESNHFSRKHSIRKLLYTTGWSILELKLSVNFTIRDRAPVTAESVCDCVGLHFCTRLRTLHLYNLFLFRDVSSRIVPWIPFLLSQVTSPFIEEIVFSVSVHEHYDLDNMPWAEIAKILESERFKSLRSVRVIVKWTDVAAEKEVGSFNNERAKDILQAEKFTSIAMRRILSIEFPKSSQWRPM